MELGISGRRAAVAAASQGLGKATAAALAAEGAHVAICSRDRDRIEAAAGDIPGAVPLVADVATEAGALEFVRAAREALGGVDILVANGGGPPPGTFAIDRDRELPRRVRAELPGDDRDVRRARARDAGTALGTGGRDHVGRGATADPQPDPLQHRACGAHRLPEDARPRGRRRRRHREHRSSRGATTPSGSGRSAATRPAPPEGAIGRPEDFGRIAAFLCSESARFVTGASLHVDGGGYAGIAVAAPGRLFRWTT